MDPTAANQALWPQLLRYGITIAGTFVTSYGVMNASEWETIAGAVMAAAPIVYRVVTTLVARKKG